MSKVIKAIRKTLKFTKPKNLLKKSPGLSLFDGVTAAYGNKQSEKAFTDKGYVKDKDLSSKHQQVYYHPDKKQTVIPVRGTKSLGDVWTDTSLLTGHVKHTQRFKEAQDTYDKANAKYNPESSVLIGHSLGGEIVSNIKSRPGVKKITYNKGAGLQYLFGKQNAKNETAYRTMFDPASIFVAHKKGTVNIPNYTQAPLASHSYNNLQDSDIFL
jgi:hypothetical protein